MAHPQRRQQFLGQCDHHPADQSYGQTAWFFQNHPDLTKRKQQEEELTRSNEDLHHINEDLDNFVYTASHDLKAPILNIEGLLKALEKQIGTEVLQKEAVGRTYQLLYGSVNRFKATVRDLTQVARISKESSEDVDRIAIEDMLAEVQEDPHPRSGKRRPR